MFFIHHLPSKTFYGLRNNTNLNTHHSLVCFRTYEEAIHVGNSIASYHYKNNSYPESSKICYSKKVDITKDALDMNLFIVNVKMEEPFVDNVFSRNLNIKVMMNVFDIDPNKSIDLTNTFHKSRFVNAIEADLYIN
jgi:hypothetical protein